MLNLIEKNNTISSRILFSATNPTVRLLVYSLCKYMQTGTEKDACILKNVMEYIFQKQPDSILNFFDIFLTDPNDNFIQTLVDTVTYNSEPKIVGDQLIIRNDSMQFLLNPNDYEFTQKTLDNRLIFVGIHEEQFQTVVLSRPVRNDNLYLPMQYLSYNNIQTEYWNMCREHYYSKNLFIITSIENSPDRFLINDECAPCPFSSDDEQTEIDSCFSDSCPDSDYDTDSSSDEQSKMSRVRRKIGTEVVYTNFLYDFQEYLKLDLEERCLGVLISHLENEITTTVDSYNQILQLRAQCGLK